MTVETEVEAILLNSECDPDQAIRGAMLALVRFAMIQCEATPEALRQCLETATGLVSEEL